MAYGNVASELFDFLGQSTNITANIVKNRLQETALDMTNIFQQTSSDCTNFNEIAFYDCEVDDMTILQNGMCKLNIKDRMSTDVQNSIDQTATVKANQTAKDVIQSISINPGSINATNVGHISSDATAKIKNRINQICKNVATNVNTFTCQNVDGLYGDYVAQDSIIKSTVNCALSADVINNTVQKMSDISDQYASATEGDALSTSVLGIFAIYMAWLLNSMLIGSNMFNLILLIVTFVLIATTCVIYWYFYDHKHNRRPFDDRCADCTTFPTKGPCEKASCKWKGSDTETVSNVNYPSLDPLCVCDPILTNCSQQCYLNTDKLTCKMANCGWDDEHKICTGDPAFCEAQTFN